jgi:hypothetical protein
VTTTPIPEPGPERRIALVPVLVAIAALIVAAALTAVIVALATQSPGTTAAPAVSPTPVEVAPAPAAPEQAPAAAPRPDPGRNECVDALGDGGALDLDAVAVASVDEGLLVRFALDDALPSGEALLGLTAIGRQDRTVLLAVRIIDGEVDEVFAVDLKSTGNDDDDDKSGRGNDDDADVDRYDEDRAQVDGRQVLVEFPDDMLKDLGNDWSWSATASSGADADRCPVEGQLTFER